MSAAPNTTSYTPISDIPKKLETLRGYFATQVTKSAKWRKEQLRAALRLMTENEDRITAALKADVGKPNFEATFTEIVSVETEIRAMIDELDEWMKPTHYPTPASLMPGDSYVVRDPYGVVLIIAPFNYPIQLTILPLIASISAGNCAVLKPSELTPASSALLAELIPKYMDNSAFQVVTGSIAETTALLKERWDYIFFTGSDMVGKVVARAAAEHLTPVTLELGGKSPVILGPDADLTLAARRVMWGKCLNAGQSCIAPDYAFVPVDLQKKFEEECVKVVKTFYAENPSSSPDFGRIVSERHTQRLAKLIDGAKDQLIYGGKYDVANKFVEPTIVTATTEQPIMNEEIFGPILPIIPYENINKVIEYINSKPKPLALYVFSTKSDFNDRILKETSSGGVSINDVMMHFANANLPFGGVGTSGQGNYHGKWGYEAFSHPKAVLNKSVYGDAPARYPPYTAFNAKLFRFVAELYKVNSATFSKMFKFVVLPVIFAVLAHRAGLTIGFKSNL